MRERQAYSPLAKALHWIVALLVMVTIPTGIVMVALDQGPLQDNLFVLHETIGILVLALMAPRLATRFLRGLAPHPSLSPAERLLSLTTHRALYLLLVVTPVVGWFALSAYGLGPSFLWIGHLPALVEKDEPLSKQLFMFHEALGWAILALIVLHIAGFVRHRMAGDDIVRRMLPRAWRR